MDNKNNSELSYEELKSINQEYLLNYYNNLIKDFKYEDKHGNILSYFYENDRGKFFTELKRFLMDGWVQFMDKFDPDTKQLIEPVFLSSFFLGEKCHYCGDSMTFKFDNHSISTLGECEKFDTYSFEVNVPSGHLVFCDWPPFGSEVLISLEDDYQSKNGHYSINNTKGCFTCSKLYADNDIIHFFVGNTSPCILKDGNNIYVEESGYDDNDEEIFLHDVDCEGSICTDLWWITAFDLDNYHKLLDNYGLSYNEFLEDIDGYGYVKVNVNPGVYKCSYERNNDDNSPHCYVKIEKVN